MGEKTTLFFTACLFYTFVDLWTRRAILCFSIYESIFDMQKFEHHKIFCSAPSSGRRPVCVHKQQIFLEKKTSEFFPSFLEMFSVVHLLSFTIVFHNISIRKKEDITEDVIFFLIFFLNCYLFLLHRTPSDCLNLKKKKKLGKVGN